MLDGWLTEDFPGASSFVLRRDGQSQLVQLGTVGGGTRSLFATVRARMIHFRAVAASKLRSFGCSSPRRRSWKRRSLGRKAGAGEALPLVQTMKSSSSQPSAARGRRKPLETWTFWVTGITERKPTKVNRAPSTSELRKAFLAALTSKYGAAAAAAPERLAAACNHQLALCSPGKSLLSNFPLSELPA